MTKKSPVAVLLLPFVTFGIYAFVWIVKAKGEMAAKGADIPTSWLLIIPFANIWYLWKWSKGVEKVTNKDMGAGAAFLLLLFLGPIGCMVIQSRFNKVA
ncbi:MAG: DUF4234 domain-containing protein [Deltaproteobacteria bacterium]|nr:DUF4234 domain-containing protein [Deltaproteobacteria bacterium]